MSNKGNSNNNEDRLELKHPDPEIRKNVEPETDMPGTDEKIMPEQGMSNFLQSPI
jgi:hypothetical protein